MLFLRVCIGEVNTELTNTKMPHFGQRFKIIDISVTKLNNNLSFLMFW